MDKIKVLNNVITYKSIRNNYKYNQSIIYTSLELCSEGVNIHGFEWHLYFQLQLNFIDPFGMTPSGKFKNSSSKLERVARRSTENHTANMVTFLHHLGRRLNNVKLKL